MKLVINKCYGGYSLSHAAVMEYAKRTGITLYPHWSFVDDTPLIAFTETIEDPLKRPDGGYLNYSLCPIDAPEFEKDDMDFNPSDIKRNDPTLIKVVEELGTAANGAHAELRVIEIPDDVEWVIEDYDGLEWVAEKHRTWN